MIFLSLFAKKPTLILFIFIGIQLSHAQDDIIKSVASLINNKEYKKAESKLKAQLLKDENEKLIELLGDVYGHQRKWTEAKNEYKKLVDIDPENAEYQYKYGGVLGMMALKNKLKGLVLIDDVKRAFTKAALLDPEHTNVRWALVELYIQLPGFVGGSIKKAEFYAEELGKIKPIEGLLAKGYIADYEEKEDEAENYYMKAMEYIHTIDEEYPRNNINYQIGKIAANYRVNLNEGLIHLNRFIKNHSSSDNVSLDWIYYQMARIFKHKNDKTNALVNIEKALSLRPDFDEAIKEKKRIEKL